MRNCNSASKAIRGSVASLLVSIWPVAAVLPASAAEPERLSLRLSFGPYGMHGPLYLAKERGWFKEAGVEVVAEDGDGSPSAVSLVGGGRFDIGEANISVMVVARDKGIPVRAIATFVRDSEMGLLYPKDAGYVDTKGLKGKKILYSAKSFEAPFIDLFFKNAGLSRDDVELVSIDVGAKMGTYLSGRGDAVFAPVPAFSVLLDQRKPSGAFLFVDYGLALPSMGYFATDDTIKKKSKALRGFVTAMNRAYKAIFEQGMADDAAAAIIKNRPQSSWREPVLKAQLLRHERYLKTAATKDKPYGWHALEDWEKALKTMRDAAVIGTGTKAGDFYTNEFFQ